MQITPTSTSHTYSWTSYDGLQPLQVPRLRFGVQFLLQASLTGIWWHLVGRYRSDGRGDGEG